MQSKDKYHDDHDINDVEHSNDDIDMDDEFFQENEHFNDADFESILGTETDHLISITSSTIQDKPPLLKSNPIVLLEGDSDNSLLQSSPELVFSTQTTKNLESQLASTLPISNMDKPSSNEPSITQPNEPSITESNEPSITESNQPSITQSNEPSITQSNEPSITESNQPSITESNQPSITQSNEPSITESNEPSITKSNEPSITNKQEIHK